MAETLTREAILQNLRDAGCDEKLIERFMAQGEGATLCDQMKLLERHRCCLMNHMHNVQRQIDCLDYLLWQMKRGTKLNCCCHADDEDKGKGQEQA